MALRREGEDRSVDGNQMEENDPDSHVPHSTSTLDSTDVDVEKLVLVDVGTDPEHNHGESRDQRSEWRVDESDGGEEEHVGVDDGVLEGWRLRPLAYISRSSGEEA